MSAPAPDGSPFRAGAGGVLVAVRLTPKASCSVIEAPAADADGRPRLKAKVTAVPEKGKANRALVKLLAKSWRLPAGSITVAAGRGDRNKTILVAGEAAALLPALEDWLRRNFR